MDEMKGLQTKLEHHKTRVDYPVVLRPHLKRFKSVNSELFFFFFNVFAPTDHNIPLALVECNVIDFMH